jgi:SnoaL-like protein
LSRGKVVDQSAASARALDEFQICNVRRAWAFSLDLGEWDTLRTCFHPDATVTVSWYSGPIGGFVERSQAMAATRKPEEHRKHWLGNMRAEIAGTRAVLETDVMILIREYIDGSLFDYMSLARFYDLFEKREGVWRIREWNCIYDKDRLDPVVPSWDASSAYAPVNLEGPDSGFAFMKLRQAKRGRTIPDTVVMRDSEAERTLRRRGRDWLAGAKM